MQKNEEKIGTVFSVGSNGEGILKDDGTVVFVPFCLPQEKIKYKVLKVSSKCAFGKVLEVISPSENRVTPKCSVFLKCGGCQLQHAIYNKQLEIKRDNVIDAFKKVALLFVPVNDTVGSDKEFRYRNKLQLPIAEINGETVVGFYAENSHRVVPIEDCVINPIWTSSLIVAVKRYIKEFSLKGYREETNSGDIREITAKEADNKLIITIVTTKRSDTEFRFVEILKEELKQEFSLYVNINNSERNAVYGEKFYLVYGSPSIQAEMLGINYKVGVQSFTQVNPYVCKLLYSEVKNSLDLDDKMTVIDAYSGAGLMSAVIAKSCKKVIGIEIVKEAVELANELDKDNGLSDRITNYQGKCEDILPKIIEKEDKKNLALVLDPPRKGVDFNVIQAIIDSGIEKIVYVSCKPSTLARDVGLIVGSLKYEDGSIKKSDKYIPRYNIQKVQPFDMFPETKHVETLCVLERINHNI